jgi:MFS family permease
MQPARIRNPWWLPPFLGRVPHGVDQPSLKLLGAVALALFFEEYDLAMLNVALPQIAADLGVPVTSLARYLWVIRLGALPAFLLIPYADRIGRRPVFIASTAIMGLLTCLTAFTRTPLEFVLCQAMTRTFFLSGSAVAFVIITEEFPAEHRGWGMGILAALGAVGHGAAAGAYAAIDVLPYGWRSLYAVGMMPLFLVPLFLRRIPETARFSQHQSASAHEGMSFRAAFAPLVELGRTHPARALGIAGSGFFAALAALPSFQFTSYYTQTALGWGPADVSKMVIGAGAVGIVGNVVAGRLGDLLGRRRVGFVLMAVFPLASLAFYNGHSAMVVVAFMALVFSSMGGRLMLRALATELFPTSQRGAASGLFSVLETLGGVTGLLLLDIYQVDQVEQMSVVVPALAAAMVPAAAILLRFPETRQRELEDIH